MTEPTPTPPPAPAAPSPTAAHAASAAPASKPPLVAEIAGWYGMLAILFAYAANNFGWLEHGALYQALNLTGALGVALVCFYRRTWQAFLLEVIWAAIALAALLGSDAS